VVVQEEFALLGIPCACASNMLQSPSMSSFCPYFDNTQGERKLLSKKLSADNACRGLGRQLGASSPPS
jgi:hypothetical protein